MFTDFLLAFSDYFMFKNPNVTDRFGLCHYGWEDEDYQSFMSELIIELEPRFEKENTVLLQENEEWLEVLFFTKGKIGIGFELNKVSKFVVHMENNAVLGAYGCSFNKRSQFIYKANTNASGYSIRKSNWVKLHKNHEQLTTHFLEAIKVKFEKDIKYKIDGVKKKEYDKLKQRADID